MYTPYRAFSKPKFATTYTPKYMASCDLSMKNNSAPKQPNGLVLNTRQLELYVHGLIMKNDITSYKYLFDQLKLIVKSVMKVRCEKKERIDEDLFRRIQTAKYSRDVIDEYYEHSRIKEVTIRLPVDSYEYVAFTSIFRAIIPYDRIPIRESYLDTNSDWYELLIYVYQNLLLTSNSKKREQIEESYAEKFKSATSKQEKNELYEERKKELAGLKDNIYKWINRIGHVIKENGYISTDCLSDDIRSTKTEFNLKFLTGVINNSFVYSELSAFDKLLDYRIRYPERAYFDAITELRKVNLPLENTVASLIDVFHKYHYKNNTVTNVLLELEIFEIVERFLDDRVIDQRVQIRVLMNRLSDSTFVDVYSQLCTFSTTSVQEILKTYVNTEPQLKVIVRVISMFDMASDTLSLLERNPGKKFRPYQNTVAWSILYGIFDLNVFNNSKIMTKDAVYSIYITLFNDRDLNIDFIKRNKKELLAIGNELLQDAPSYYKSVFTKEINDTLSNL